MYWNIWTWSCSFFSAHGLSWQACVKKTEVDLGICHAIHRYARGNNKYVKIFDKETSCLMYLDAKNLYG